MVGVNPRPGRNLLETFEDRLGFVERAPKVVEALTELLGADYEVMNRKVVCGVPASAVPAWLHARIAGNPVNNLGAWVKPEYRDITYFYGIDFHQDLIDFKDRDADFVTLYVYLHPVGAADAPLFLLEGSHVPRRERLPTRPDRRMETAAGSYRDGRGDEAIVHQQACWSAGPAMSPCGMPAPCTGPSRTPPTTSACRCATCSARRRPAAAAWRSRVNAALRGPLRLTATREDLADDGSARIRRNTVNQSR